MHDTGEISFGNPTTPALDVVTNKLAHLSTEGPVLDTDRKLAFNVLERAGLVELKGPDIVVDLATLQGDIRYKQFARQLGVFSRGESGNQVRDKIATLYDIFNGVDVLSKEDYEKRDRGESVTAKPLFYIPESAVAAVDPEKIAQSDFYLGLWQLGGNTFPENYPTRSEGQNSGLLPHEAIVAALIFHPQFGAATRGEDGKLMVTAKDGTRRPISAEFFRSWQYSGGPNVAEFPLLSRPAEFFVSRTPNLVGAGLINPERDFRTVTGTATELSTGYTIHTPTERGLVMIDKQRYTLGAEYAGNKGVTVTKISDKLAGIIKKSADGEEIVEAVFALRAPGSVHPGTTPLRKDDVFIRPIDTLDAMSHEAMLAHNFKVLLRFNKEFVRETGVSLVSLNQTERVRALGVYLQVGAKAEFSDFIRRHKMNGLRTLMLAGADTDAVGSIISIGTLPVASSLFQEGARISARLSAEHDRAVAQADSPLVQRSQEIISVLSEHAQRLVLSAASVNAKEIPGVGMNDVVSTLVSFRKTLEHTHTHGAGQESEYQKLLNLAYEKRGNNAAHTLLLDIIRHDWQAQVAAETIQDRRTPDTTQAAIERFYQDNAALFESASQTTGDTQQEMSRWEQYAHESSITGVLADLGCGVGRLTEQKAQILAGKARIIGVDLLPPQHDSPADNLTYIQGNLTSIPLPDNSIDAADADWSVLNDATRRSDQLSIFSEVTRILKVGGTFRFDVPHLEGGEGSWRQVADEYHRLHPHEPYGMIEADFPGGRKAFHIYPEAELEAMLRANGFEVAKKDAWRTQAGKPRMTFEARLIHKVTPYHGL